MSQPQTTTFGPAVISQTELEAALRDYIGKWWYEYAAQYERDHGKAPRFYPPPFTIETATEFEKWEENALPHIICTVAGLTDRPQRLGDGSWRATWLVAIVHVAGSSDRLSTRELALTYGEITRWMLDQAGDVSDAIVDITWSDVSQGPNDPSLAQTIATQTEVFEITAALGWTGYGRPPFDEPRDNPYGDNIYDPVVGDGPTATSVDLSIEKEIPQ